MHCHTRFLRLLTPLVLCLLLGAPPATQAAAPALTPFTATYQVLRNGSALGTSTLALRAAADGNWSFRSHLKAESGVAAMLGGELDETSTFRVQDGALESLSYASSLDSAIKARQQQMHFDWSAHQVRVEDDKGRRSYATVPGLVDQQVAMLAAAAKVAAGQHQFQLAVASAKRIKTRTFTLAGTARVSVPAGDFAAQEVRRGGDDNGFRAWFLPARFGLAPVKLEQAEDGITLLLKSYRAGA